MSGRIVALSGGVGGAKLAHGLALAMPQENLTVIANTGDDFHHLGLAISPDIDTLVYTLSGLAHPTQGWGRKDETFHFMAALKELGGATWFNLGDRDLAMHVERTGRLTSGESLSAITQGIARRLGVRARILPMSDDPVATRLKTDSGWLDFQDYFVRLRCEPEVCAIAFQGAEEATPGPGVIEAFEGGDLRAVVICPSNPFLSIEPILAVPGIRKALAACRAPRIAVSPIVGGQAVKGPTVKLMNELGLRVDNETIAERYDGLIDCLLIDAADAKKAGEPGLLRQSASILMKDAADRRRLAEEVLALADRLFRTRRVA